ncbi:MAG: hypothetical protein KGL20_05605 [Rhodospirillales bacterium]|nr:hypothetical protein [Rhodospirillales bacterium]
MMTAEEIVERLEEAGAAMLAMPSRGYSTGLRTTKMDVVHTALEAYGWESAKMKPPAPCAATVTRMDEAFGWLLFVPEKQYVLRRIAGARALVHPLTGRHLFPWRRLGEVLGADHKSVQRWHGQAIKLIQEGLAKR